MSRQSQGVKTWRKNCKQRIIDAMGKKCQICGYNKCNNALTLHHIDPTKKELSFGNLRANPKSWELVIKELRKCVLLCSNCHMEIHHGITILPTHFSIFNEDFVDYTNMYETDDCPVCRKEKPIFRQTCSLSCAGRLGRKIDWTAIDLKTLLITNSIPVISDYLHISSSAIYKRMNKIGIRTTYNQKLIIQTGNKIRPRKFEISKEDLYKLVWEYPTIEVAKMFSVSDSAIGKRCKLLGINKPPRGYWAKQNKIIPVLA